MKELDVKPKISFKNERKYFVPNFCIEKFLQLMYSKSFCCLLWLLVFRYVYFKTSKSVMKQLRENKLILLLNWCYYSITKFSKYYIKFFLDLRLSFLIIRNYYVTILTIEIHGYQKKNLF